MPSRRGVCCEVCLIKIATRTVPTGESFNTRRADAMLEVAESYLNHGPTSSSTADCYQVGVHVSAETLRKGTAQEESTEEHEITAVTSGYINADLSHLEDGHHVSAETCVPNWCAGDRMDWDLGVMHLFTCSEKGAETIN